MGSQPGENMWKYKKYEKNNFVCVIFFNNFNLIHFYSQNTKYSRTKIKRSYLTNLVQTN